MKIREATPEDFEAIWSIFHEIVSAGETYPYPPDTTQPQAYKFGWSSRTKRSSPKRMGKLWGRTISRKTNPAQDRMFVTAAIWSRPLSEVAAWPRRCAFIPNKWPLNSVIGRCSSIWWLLPTRSPSICGRSSAFRLWGECREHSIIKRTDLSMRW